MQEKWLVAIAVAFVGLLGLGAVTSLRQGNRDRETSRKAQGTSQPSVARGSAGSGEAAGAIGGNPISAPAPSSPATTTQASPGLGSEAEKFVGQWDAIGASYVLIYNRDGSFTRIYLGDPVNGNWHVAGSEIVMSNPLPGENKNNVYSAKILAEGTALAFGGFTFNKHKA